MSPRRIIVEPRGLASTRIKLLVPVVSVIAALIVAGIFLLLTGESPVEVYAKMLDASFGSPRGISETLISSTPLILTGVAAAIAFKMQVWNIGAEGQFLMGAIFSAGIAIWLGDGFPAVVMIPAVVIAGGLGGAFWAAISALPRVYLGTNEIITTLMLNFIAINFVNFLIFGSSSPWRDSAVATFPTGRSIPGAARLPEFFFRLDIGIFIAIVPVAVLMGALNNSGPALQSIGVPTATVAMLQGAILLFAVAGEFLIENRIRRPDVPSVSASPKPEAA